MNLVLVPEAGSSYLLPLQIGHLRATELCLLGDAINSEKARDFGVINEIVAVEDLLPLARQKAAQIASKPPVAIQLTKALLKQVHQKPMLEQMKTEETLFLKLLRSTETIDFLKSFFTRKK